MIDSTHAGSAFPVVALVFFIYLLLFAGAIINYILQSLAIYRIAKRRGLPAPGLAWAPVANNWTIGGIADQYDSTHGIKRKWRVSLLTLACVGIALVLVGVILLVVGAIQLALRSGLYVESSIFSKVLFMILGYVLFLVGYILLLINMIFTLICVFKIFESCHPAKAVKYLVVSLLLPFGYSICLMLCSKRDYGMPAPPEPVVPVVPQEQPMMYFAPVQDFPPQTFE